ncbi:MAG TPA: hypothetical protein VMW67_06955 [Desulfobacteria bacterium]|nr:hypothetical protein [Desulfobacteria bacterium]
MRTPRSRNAELERFQAIGTPAHGRREEHPDQAGERFGGQLCLRLHLLSSRVFQFISYNQDMGGVVRAVFDRR